MASATSSVSWGGLWQTVYELPDAKDALPELEHVAKGFAALEAARTIPDVKTALLAWFGDKHTRNRLNSSLLDQLYLLLTVPLKQHPYICATVLGFTHALQFLLRLDDAPDKDGLVQVLAWAREHRQEDIVKYLTDLGVRRTWFVSQTPFVIEERVHQAGTIPRTQDVFYWIEPVTQGEHIILTDNGNPLFVFSERLLFDTPFPQVLLYLTHLGVTGAVRCGVGDLTKASRSTLSSLLQVHDLRYRHNKMGFILNHGRIHAQGHIPDSAIRLFEVEAGKEFTDQHSSHVAPMSTLALPDLSDEAVYEIKRLTGWSWMRLFAVS